MDTPNQIAKHLREVYLGGNWTCSDLRGQLNDVTWEEACTQVYGLNSIATLTHHISYYVTAVLRVLQGGELNAKDEFSFNHPELQSDKDWDNMQIRIWQEVEGFASAIEKLPSEKLGEVFCDEKYGVYFRNLLGIIEHSHYHLGQIALIKKIIRAKHA